MGERDRARLRPTRRFTGTRPTTNGIFYPTTGRRSGSRLTTRPASPVARVERTHHARPGRACHRPRLLDRGEAAVPLADRAASRVPAARRGRQCACRARPRLPWRSPIRARSSPVRRCLPPDRRFVSLAEVPARAGGSVDAGMPCRFQRMSRSSSRSRAPAAAPRSPIAPRGTGSTLTWQAEHFPSLLLWYSNRGRKGAPWSGRHVAIGIEPICSPFGLGPATARADNPLARSGVLTAFDFSPDRPFTTRYRIEAETL